MNVLDIFYKCIVPEASCGRIDCLTFYNIVFSTNIVEENREYLCHLDDDDLVVPTLIIKDKETFDKLLLEYVNLALNFYDDSNFDNEILNYRLYDNKKMICKEKIILALLFANATTDDFNNPIEFLKRRINFFNCSKLNDIDLGYCDSLKGNLFLDIEKDIINNETPYQIVIKCISNDGIIFEFPKIKFGISDGVVYIYAIQNRKNDTNHFCKYINRILYKIGEGFSSDMDDSDENLKDVTASFLVGLNISISYLFYNGFSKFVVPSFLVERWNAKCIANNLKISRKNLSQEEISTLNETHGILQNNLTNKLIRTFLRLGCHYNNVDILSFPYEMDSCLHICLNDNDLKCNNSLLCETNVVLRKSVTNNKKTR